MRTGPTPRERARAETTARIKQLALAQLAGTAAGALSLRAIARELNLVSSAIYRYYPSRDDLLTDLIVDAYTDLAETLSAAPSASASRRQTWARTCAALREWAVAAPHRFALVYGSAIPGYVAPERTIAPAGLVIQALLSSAVGGHPAEPERPISPDLQAQLTRVADVTGLAGSTASGGSDPATEPDGSGAATEFAEASESILLATGALARLIGALTLELGGHFVGGFEPADALYAELVEREADALGL